jgi:hypothetical protein
MQKVEGYVITERKSALRRKREISEEIDYIRSLRWKQTILATAIPFADKHVATLQIEFNDLEKRFPASTKRRAASRRDEWDRFDGADKFWVN